MDAAIYTLQVLGGTQNSASVEIAYGECLLRECLARVVATGAITAKITRNMGDARVTAIVNGDVNGIVIELARADVEQVKPKGSSRGRLIANPGDFRKLFDDDASPEAISGYGPYMFGTTDDNDEHAAYAEATATTEYGDEYWRDDAWLNRISWGKITPSGSGLNPRRLFCNGNTLFTTTYDAVAAAAPGITCACLGNPEPITGNRYVYIGLAALISTISETDAHSYKNVDVGEPGLFRMLSSTTDTGELLTVSSGSLERVSAAPTGVYTLISPDGRYAMYRKLTNVGARWDAYVLTDDTEGEQVYAITFGLFDIKSGSVVYEKTINIYQSHWQEYNQLHDNLVRHIGEAWIDGRPVLNILRERVIRGFGNDSENLTDDQGGEKLNYYNQFTWLFCRYDLYDDIETPLHEFPPYIARSVRHTNVYECDYWHIGDIVGVLRSDKFTDRTVFSFQRHQVEFDKVEKWISRGILLYDGGNVVELAEFKVYRELEDGTRPYYTLFTPGMEPLCDGFFESPCMQSAHVGPYGGPIEYIRGYYPTSMRYSFFTSVQNGAYINRYLKCGTTGGSVDNANYGVAFGDGDVIIFHVITTTQQSSAGRVNWAQLL